MKRVVASHVIAKFIGTVNYLDQLMFWGLFLVKYRGVAPTTSVGIDMELGQRSVASAT